MLAKDFRDPLYRSYSTLTFIVFAWAFTFFLFSTLDWRIFESLHLIFNLALGPVSMWFMKVLLQPKGNFFRYCIKLSFLLAIILIPPVILGLDRYALIRYASYFSPILIFFSVLYLYFMEALGFVVPSAGRITLSKRKNILQVLRRRNFSLYFGGAFLTLTCVMDRVSWMGTVLPAIGNLFLAIYFYFLMKIVLEEGYISLRHLSSQFLSNMACAIVIALSFFLIGFWVMDQPVLLFINIIIASYLVIMYAAPLSRFFSVIFQKILFKESHRLEELDRVASQRLLGAFSLSQIREVIDDFLQGALDVPIQSFYVLEENGKSFKRAYSLFPEKEASKEISIFNPVVLYWKNNQGWIPLFLDKLKVDAARIISRSDVSLTLSTIESLNNLKADIIIPIAHEEIVLGFVTIKLDSFSVGEWDRAWVVPMLKDFFLKTGRSLESLDMYTNFRNRERLTVLGEMSAGLAHEIRNPLGAIKGAAQVLKDPQTKKKDVFVDIITEGVDRLNNVVSRFLDYAKPFQGVMEQVDLKKLGEKTLESFVYKMKGEGINIEVNFSAQDSLPFVYCQGDLISQVILNFLENAKQAVTGGHFQSKKAFLSMRIGYEENVGGGSFFVEVRDNGPGMEAENLEKAFIPFYTTSQGGVGMGLPICQRIAEVHNGDIKLHSEKGKGTVATLYFSSKAKTQERNVSGKYNP